MDDQEYDRLRKFLVISWLCLLAVIIGLTAWGSYELRTLKSEVAYKDAQLRGEIPYVRDGKEGKQGAVGVRGPQGYSGANGQNGRNGAPGATGPQGETGPMGSQGPQGEKGDTGATGPQGPQGETGAQGRTAFSRTNPITGEGECRYAGDDEWQPESECQ